MNIYSEFVFVFEPGGGAPLDFTLYTAADEVEPICRLLVLGDGEEVVGGGGDDARLKKPFREERIQSQCWSWGWKCFRACGKIEQQHDGE